MVQSQFNFEIEYKVTCAGEEGGREAVLQLFSLFLFLKTATCKCASNQFCEAVDGPPLPPHNLSASCCHSCDIVTVTLSLCVSLSV